jgi:Ca2+/Na+ antiporter
MNTMSVLLTMYPWGIDDLTGLIAAVLLLSLPIWIALFVYRHKVNATNKRTQIIITALEKNEGSLPEELIRSINEPKKSIKERLLGKLLLGILCSLAGLGLVIAVIVEYCTGAREYLDADFLAIGLIIMAAGVAFLVYYFIGKRALQAEIEAEERKAKSNL